MSEKIKSGACEKDEIVQSLKAYTANGYKNASFMAFGDAATYMLDIRPGAVIAVINPRLMPKRGDERGYMFCVDT